MFFRKKEKPSVGRAIAFITQAIDTAHRHNRNRSVPTPEELKELQELEQRLWDAHNTIRALNNSLNQRAAERQKGFTLLELSVVLVIIGLIVGGIYLGQAIVESAKIRAQLSQLDRYKAAVNTFKLKYGALPGDVTPARAAAFGFVSRTGNTGDGDGDGHIGWAGLPTASLYPLLGGETVLFWTDLSSAKLIAESFTDSLGDTDNIISGGHASIDFSQYLPNAKIGTGSIIAFDNVLNGIPNYSGLVFEIGTVYATNSTYIAPNSALTVNQAYAIDAKIDDGMPTTGLVVIALPSTSIGTGRAGTSGASGGGSWCWASNNPPTLNYNLSQASSLACDLMIAGQ